MPLADLGVKIKDAEKAVTATTDLSGSAAEPVALDEGDMVSGSGGVSVDVDRVTKAGGVVSGTVSFSDGTKATWMLDALGRLALSAGKEGYKPSEQDLRSFQEEVSRQLRKKGF